MFEARQGKEIVVKLRNRVGLLFDISKLISESGVSILAVYSSFSGEESVSRLVTDDNLRVTDFAPRKRIPCRGGRRNLDGTAP
jgi:hypothetical protein